MSNKDDSVSGVGPARTRFHELLEEVAPIDRQAMALDLDRWRQQWLTEARGLGRDDASQRVFRFEKAIELAYILLAHTPTAGAHDNQALTRRGRLESLAELTLQLLDLCAAIGFPYGQESVAVRVHDVWRSKHLVFGHAGLIAHEQMR